MRRAAIAIPRVARRGVATMLIAFAGVRYVAKGQSEKNSVRVYVFRCAHKLGHCLTQLALRI
jgi:hypothetical protein